MAKHTVLIAVTVDDSHSVNAVANEIKYFLPFITSECLDTVIDVIPARIKQQVKTYQVWHPDHVAMYADSSADTYEELVAVEAHTDCSFSSFITTDDIDGIVSAVQNEFNGDLQYHLVSGA